MSLIDVGIPYDKAEEENRGPKKYMVEGKKYEFEVSDVEQGVFGTGREFTRFQCSVINDPEFPNWRVRYTYNHPIAGEGNTYLWRLTNLFKACGVKWEGTAVDPELVRRKTFSAEIVNKKRLGKDEHGNKVEMLNDDGEPIIDTEIKRFVK